MIALLVCRLTAPVSITRYQHSGCSTRREYSASRLSGPYDRETHFSIVMFCNHDLKCSFSTNKSFSLWSCQRLVAVISHQFTLTHSVQFAPSQPSPKKDNFPLFS